MSDKKIKERLWADLELPALAAKQCAQIELSGNKAATIEGCKGIVEYSEEKIVLSLGSCCLRVNGAALEISSFGSENAAISGNITGLEFC